MYHEVEVGLISRLIVLEANDKNSVTWRRRHLLLRRAIIQICKYIHQWY
jgi:hypothetical protein